MPDKDERKPAKPAIEGLPGIARQYVAVAEEPASAKAAKAIVSFQHVNAKRKQARAANSKPRGRR